MFGSDSFPVGPNGQFPRQRISNYGVSIVPPVSMQDTYLSGNNTISKLPVLEKDFHSSVLRVKGPMRHGVMMRGGRRMFRPRYALTTLGQEEEYPSMDEDILFDTSGHRFDEGETDDSVGQTKTMTRAGMWNGWMERRPAGRAMGWGVMPNIERLRALKEEANARAAEAARQQEAMERKRALYTARWGEDKRKVVPSMKGEGWGTAMRAAVEKIGAKSIHPATGVPSRSLQAVGSGGWLKAIQSLFAGKGVGQKPMVAEAAKTAVMRGTAIRMSAGLFGDDSGMGALPRYTTSGRKIGRTWKYGKSTYYSTIRDGKGIVERGQIVGGGTSPIDYI